MCSFRMFERINQSWGLFIATYPRCHIFVSLALTALFSFYLKFIQIENDIRTSFSPPSSKSA